MEENKMDSITTNTPAPTVSTEATQPVQQAQPDKSARFKEKAENQASKVMAEIEKLQKLSNKKYYTYSTEQINELFGAIQSALHNNQCRKEETVYLFCIDSKATQQSIWQSNLPDTQNIIRKEEVLRWRD